MRTMMKHVKAKDLGAALRKRLRLAPDDEVKVTVTKRAAKGREQDPWLLVKGSLSPEEADEWTRVIKESRRSKADAPDVENL
jgi:hypothetical protein